MAWIFTVSLQLQQSCRSQLQDPYTWPLTVNVFTFISLGYDFCPVHCLDSSLQLCVEIMPYWLPGMLTPFHAHPLCLARAFFGNFIVYSVLANILIHVFLCCAVTSGSAIQRFYFQARMLIIHVTLKPYDEKLTFQNKEVCLNFVVAFLWL